MQDRRSMFVQNMRVLETISKLTDSKAPSSWPLFASRRSMKNMFWRCSSLMISRVYSNEMSSFLFCTSSSFRVRISGNPATVRSCRSLISLKGAYQQRNHVFQIGSYVLQLPRSSLTTTSRPTSRSPGRERSRIFRPGYVPASPGPGRWWQSKARLWYSTRFHRARPRGAPAMLRRRGGGRPSGPGEEECARTGG